MQYATSGGKSGSRGIVASGQSAVGMRTPSPGSCTHTITCKRAEQNATASYSSDADACAFVVYHKGEQVFPHLGHCVPVQLFGF